jgi:hypothetical protein
MRTPSTLLDPSRSGATPGHTVVALCLLAGLFVSPVSVRAGSDKLGFADYQNIWFTSGPVQLPGVSDYAATNTTMYQGHVGPYAAPQSGDTPTTPTDGVVCTMIQSSFGAPVGGQTFFGADFYVGEEITPPAGEVTIPLNHIPIVDPPTRAFYVPTARKLFAGDRGTVNVTWNTIQGTSRVMTYVISNRPVQEPVRIYHTEQDKGSLVDFTSAPTVAIHYNDTITTRSRLWLAADKKMHATTETGLVVLHYDRGTSFAGIEVVDVRPYLPDFRTTTTYVGAILTPRQYIQDQIAFPTVSRGDTGLRPYVFQYGFDKTPSLAAQVFPVRPTSANNQIHLYWKQTGRFPGVEWPYELHAYQARWSPDTVWDRIYHTYDGTLAPPVNVANVDVVQFFYNDEITTNRTIFTNTSHREIRGLSGSETGRILARLDLAGATGPSFLQFVDVRPYVPDNITNVYVGRTLTPTTSPLDMVIAPVVIRGTEGVKPYAYQYGSDKATTVAGQVFAVRPTSANTQVRLFWKHTGHYPGMEWPYELRAYQASWDPATDWQRIYYSNTLTEAMGGPTINVASVDILQFFYNDKITSTGTIFMNLNPREIRATDAGGLAERGEILLRMDDQASSWPSVLEFVQVFPYSPDWVTQKNTGDILPPFRTVANPLQEETYVRRGWNGNPTDPVNYAYQHNTPGTYRGAVFAVRPTTQDNQIEVFFKRLGKKGLIWPYEMHRYKDDWPTAIQLFVRGSNTLVPGPKVPISKELHAQLMPFQEYIALNNVRTPLQHADLNGDQFFSDLATKSIGNYYALLQYQIGPPNSPGSEWVGFEPVKCVRNGDVRYFDLTLRPRSIGTEITDPYHQGPLPGFIYHVEGVDNEDKYDPLVYNEGAGGYSTGQVFPVFPGKLEVWWSNVTTHGLTLGNSYGVQWPSKVMRYTNDWPTTPELMVIASQTGSGMIPFAHRYPEVYYQNDKTKKGYDPNYEHAALFPLDSGLGAFALRCDLNAQSTDKKTPYVLLKYRDANDRGLWRFRVFQVLPEDDVHKFWYQAKAGSLIQPPYPLAALPDCGETSSAIHNGNYGVAGPFWQDRNRSFWARAASDDGGTTQIVMRYWYPVEEGFLFPNPADNDTYPVGERTPWLDKLRAPTYNPDIPVDVRYTVSWPDIIPTLKTGETLVTQKFGLPNIMGQCSVEVIYESINHPGHPIVGGQNVRLIDPLRERAVYLDRLPTGPDAVTTENHGGKLYFSDLPPYLKNRISYDELNKTLALVGEYYPMLGESLLLVNVLTARDKQFLYMLTTNGLFRTAVDDLCTTASEPIILGSLDSNSAGKAVVGVSSGNGGYVTLAMQNHEKCRPLPVSLEIIRVVDDLYKGEIKVIEPDCAFDEKLTLRHTGDFAGKADQYTFKWEYHPDMDGLQPPTTSPLWLPFPSVPPDGQGALDVTIYGPGLFTLSDNWFHVRYRRSTDPNQDRYYSTLTPAQLAPGWIKRVIGRINPYTQRASGGGIQGAEQRFSQFQTQTVNTVVSMISQAGARWVGSVPMNCSGGLNNLGLIEIYDTVLGRGKQLSVDAGYRYPPANNALLLAAGRIADLYMLLGNEAYADAADPTIAYGTEDRTYGAEASSIHCFMNQTASLLEEELALLRGRDDSAAPGVQLYPLYNHLMWNFTKDINGGEVAYALNYNIQDANGNADGTINELDAMKLYPQGHGDAWGHYLTATKRYYGLLKHRNFDWVPRAEAVLVGGQPVTVDYLDERKFATAAAAKARTGAEIVNLTYRQAYVEDPTGQWQGYKDTKNADRAWGLSEWASRAGQGAYFDWVVGNSILPASDTLHTGIQKVDRLTVAELREIAGDFNDIQMQMDQADIGLNPLGLGKNVVPFDIDPAIVYSPTAPWAKTHFEQIYDRALQALTNAVTVFNHAANCTQLLRRQADSQTDFRNNVTDREADFNSRLIEIFGYPYAGDIGAGKTYPQGYDGPDLINYDYVDVSALLGTKREPTKTITATFLDINTSISETGHLAGTTQTITFHVSVNGFGKCLPEGQDWGQRRAPGQIQQARSQLIQTYGQFERIRAEYNALIGEMDNLSDKIDERRQLKTDRINIIKTANSQIKTFRAVKMAAHEVQLGCEKIKEGCKIAAEAGVETIPKSMIIGLASGGDMFSPARGAIKMVSGGVRIAAGIVGMIAKITQAAMDVAESAVKTQEELDLLTETEDWEIRELVFELRDLIRKENGKRLELMTQAEAIVQAMGEYNAALARGLRLIDDRTRFRIQTASKVQDYRYKDMAFRIFRNDALQKYRAQFDLAARYVYLAAKAYDYETNLLSQDRQAGEYFMTSIVRARAIGNVIDGAPQTGSGMGDPGLADVMARMKLNWDLVLKGQLGFSNPQTETNRFSLRQEMFRTVTDQKWREVLKQYKVEDILSLPEFKRYCRVFEPHQAAEPGIVIPISTTINFGFNFFGRELASGDSAYDSTNFATKIRSVGVWFGGYDALTSQGMSNTPRVYLIPVGYDIMRSPTGESGEIRIWKILDQKLPTPFPIGAIDLATPAWIPMVDTLSEEYAAVRRFSSFRAYHDSGVFDPSETIADSRLVGRSVWNTRWLLIIPAGTLHSDRQKGLDTFINGVTDIKVFFQTYAYSGN